MKIIALFTPIRNEIYNKKMENKIGNIFVFESKYMINNKSDKIMIFIKKNENKEILFNKNSFNKKSFNEYIVK